MADIFVDSNGDPLTFYTTPSNEGAGPTKYSKAELRKKIEAHGGKMLGKPEAGCIRLVRKDSVVSGTSFDYIYTCIHESKLLDEGIFKITPAMPKKKAARGKRTEWSNAEEQAIIEYCRMYGSSDEISGAKVPSRPWMQTMVENLPGVVVHKTESVRSRWRMVLKNTLAMNRFTKIKPTPKLKPGKAQPKPAVIEDDDDPIESAGSDDDDDDSDFQQRRKLPPRTKRPATSTASAASGSASASAATKPTRRGQAAVATMDSAADEAHGGSDGSESDDDDELDDCDTELMDLLKQQQQPEEVPEKATSVDTQDEAEEHVVEYIEQVNADSSQYKIKWKGYPKSESTWEPVENLSKALTDEWSAQQRMTEQQLAKTDPSRNPIKGSRATHASAHPTPRSTLQQALEAKKKTAKTAGAGAEPEPESAARPPPPLAEEADSPQTLRRGRSGGGNIASQPAAVQNTNSKAKAQKKRKTPEPAPVTATTTRTGRKKQKSQGAMKESIPEAEPELSEMEMAEEEEEEEEEEVDLSTDMVMFKKVMEHLIVKTNRTPLQVLQTMYNCSGNAAHALKAMANPGSMKLWAPDHDKWLASTDAAAVENAERIYGLAATSRRIIWNES